MSEGDANVVDVGIEETLERARVAPASFRFHDMVHLQEALGFRLARVNGSHHIFTHPVVSELVNLQEVGGTCKPYQVRQVLKLVDRYNLGNE